MMLIVYIKKDIYWFMALADLHSELSECSTPKRKRSLPLAGNRSPTLGVTPKSRKAVLDTVCDYVICALDLRKRSSFLKTVGVTRKQQLTPKSRKLYHIATALQRTARRLDYENIDLKQRVELADNFIKSEEFMHTVVNDVAAKFIMSQIKLQKIKPRGRRFTLDDKLLALSIMKQSPKGYRFLQKVFALPARKTLNKLLHQVPFYCGINGSIVNSLKRISSKLKDTDKLCTIIFDEMSLTAGLSYNSNTDSIDGFEDCGLSKRPVFADHAMVFMARGICRKWKQPIAYYFSEGGMKSADLERNLKVVIEAVTSAGLNVVAVVGDQLSTNRSVFNKLKEKTNAECIRRNVENRYEGFIIDNREIVPLFDPHIY
ncbi:thap domain-containing protein 9 [Holotrichia oblita]|uniref:Thap domain-containing protein 9 n=1 Tax=Holotrichia oblita TaxID=644536 RepID=A0ACB9STV4_HOLOL|nr:thap domain-containing protein 9 [Holotrichia oblita]